jgi:hypothetical protein
MNNILYKIFHPIKNLYLRYRYGAGCCDIFNTDFYLATKILPVLKQFRKRVLSRPLDIDSIEDWETILDKMIFSFESIVNEDDFAIFGEKEITDRELFYKKRQEGLELFGKHFSDLWK